MMATVRTRWSSRLKLLLERFGGMPAAAVAAPPEPLPDAPLIRPFPWEAHYPDGLAWPLALAPRPLYSLLDEAGRAYADRPCLDFLGRKSSYREIAQLVDRAAKGFQALGVGKGVPGRPVPAQLPVLRDLLLPCSRRAAPWSTTTRSTPTARSRGRSRIPAPRSWSP